MKSATLPSFWSAYARLDENIRRSARKAYRLWAENPFHPSLCFECINREENIRLQVNHKSGAAVGGVYQQMQELANGQNA